MKPTTSNRRQITRLAMACAMGLPLVSLGQTSPGSTLRVGPGRAIRTLAQAARVARAGALIEVDAGDYLGDVAVWTQDDLHLRGVGGRVRLLAQGAAAEGKAIWVVRARRMQAHGFDFEACAVPARNGAGIRFESGSLKVRNCSFSLNEMGLLTASDVNATLDVENCEFAHNMRADGHNHNLYVGGIGRLSVSGSYFHHARTGHLLKSRAALNQIFYNRLTDESGGSASYELEFPNGGVAQVVGNLIEQGLQTENPFLISAGAEGYKWPRNELHLIHNTLVNLVPQGGNFLRTLPGMAEIRAFNNLLVGHGELESGGPGDYRSNFVALPGEFADLAAHDVRLRASSRLLGRAMDLGNLDGQNLAPNREYFHPRGTRPVAASKHNPGAMQSVV